MMPISGSLNNPATALLARAALSRIRNRALVKQRREAAGGLRRKVIGATETRTPCCGTFACRIVMAFFVSQYPSVDAWHNCRGRACRPGVGRRRRHSGHRDQPTCRSRCARRTWILLARPPALSPPSPPAREPIPRMRRWIFHLEIVACQPGQTAIPTHYKPGIPLFLMHLHCFGLDNSLLSVLKKSNGSEYASTWTLLGAVPDSGIRAGRLRLDRGAGDRSVGSGRS